MVFDVKQLPGTPVQPRVFGDSVKWPFWGNVSFVGLRTQSNFRVLKFWNNLKPCTLPVLDPCVSKILDERMVGFREKEQWKIRWGALDHRDVRLLQGPSLSPTFSTFSPHPKCAPDVQKQHVRLVLIWGFCSSCIYFMVARYPESWGVGEGWVNWPCLWELLIRAALGALKSHSSELLKFSSLITPLW